MFFLLPCTPLDGIQLIYLAPIHLFGLDEKRLEGPIL